MVPDLTDSNDYRDWLRPFKERSFRRFLWCLLNPVDRVDRGPSKIDQAVVRKTSDRLLESRNLTISA